MGEIFLWTAHAGNSRCVLSNGCFQTLPVCVCVCVCVLWLRQAAGSAGGVPGVLLLTPGCRVDTDLSSCVPIVSLSPSLSLPQSLQYAYGLCSTIMDQLFSNTLVSLHARTCTLTALC